MPDDMTVQIARRLRARREYLGLSQDQLAERMGLNHRQTLTQIENGERKIQPSELAAAARALDVRLDYFTDPYKAAGEATFSFRADTADEGLLADFERTAGDWLATYRALGMPDFLKKALSLSDRSSYEQAQAAGEQTARELRLGRCPANGLQEALEREWGVLVLYVDFPPGISGAASRLEGLQAILVNRHESVGRRHYDLAHELFHLLTWDTMPPARLDTEQVRGRAARSVEQLANNFASALLMPSDSVRTAWDERGELPLIDRIVVLADDFKVSAPAMKWRVANLDLVARGALPEDAKLAAVAGTGGRPDVKPPLFNVEFVRRLHSAVEDGVLSLRKATQILATDTAGFAELCRSYGRQLTYDV
jgi:transcriptional regulator with XRE-family HTH domain/Zn-dependent peptidase ImmA (M78 family)